MSASVKQRYDLLDIHDSKIQCINIDPVAGTCLLSLHGAAVLKNSSQPFDYEVVYEPAQLTFYGVREIHFPEGYCLNRTIVTDIVASTKDVDCFRFSLSMTGGWDNDTFMRTIEIIAKDFSLTGTALVSECP
jgi:hypothetical protein